MFFICVFSFVKIFIVSNAQTFLKKTPLLTPDHYWHSLIETSQENMIVRIYEPAFNSGKFIKKIPFFKRALVAFKHSTTILVLTHFRIASSKKDK